MYKKFYDTIDKYYEQKYKDIKKKINPDQDNEYEYVFTKINDKQIVEVFLKDKFLLKAEFCVLGIYNTPMSMWYWSWAIAFINKQLIVAPIELIKGFNDVIETHYDKFDKKEVEELQYLVSNDSMFISNDNVKIIVKLGLYLIKGIWVLRVKQQDKIQYLVITKILQY